MADEYAIRAYLGEFEVTDDQFKAICRASDEVDARYPVPKDGEPADVTDERTAAFNAAVQVILGDTTPEAEVDAWQAALRRSLDAHAAMTGAIIALRGEESERSIAERLQLHRNTVRKALGH